MTTPIPPTNARPRVPLDGSPRLSDEQLREWANVLAEQQNHAALGLIDEVLEWRAIGRALTASMDDEHRIDCPLCGKAMNELVDNTTGHLFWCCHDRAAALLEDV